MSNYFNEFTCDLYDFTNKQKSVSDYVKYMLNRTQRIFKYENLPDTIPQRNLELMLQLNGSVGFTKVNDKYYVFTGGLGGEPNVYYMPTILTVANPYLKYNAMLEIDKDCVIIPNDSMYLGLKPLHTKYATMLVENDISLNMVDIITRIQAMISASDDNTKLSADKYLSDIVSGKLGTIAESAFLDGIKTSPFSKDNDALKALIEYQQYIKASWYNELGLNANYNMKREALNSSESALNDDILVPLIDDMLENRKLALEKINTMYGLNISVDLDSAWKSNEIELDIELDKIDENENGGTQENEETENIE